MAVEIKVAETHRGVIITGLDHIDPVDVQIGYYGTNHCDWYHSVPERGEKSWGCVSRLRPINYVAVWGYGFSEEENPPPLAQWKSESDVPPPPPPQSPTIPPPELTG